VLVAPLVEMRTLASLNAGAAQLHHFLPSCSVEELEGNRDV